ncbi:hypothetical protein A2U01_0060354, partial [Trifolium medium]|nr:hypothetical protein [Trifolium medium]
MQKKLEAQEVEQGKIKEELKSLSAGQQNLAKTQEDISSKLSALLAHFAPNPKDFL